MTILKRYDDEGILDKYREEMEEHRLTGEPFILELDPSNGEESEDNTCADEQTQQGEDSPENAKDSSDGDGGETQHDIVESLTSNKDD
ncbi:hypothetical protein ACFX1W_019175 [Malus domestica]